jgi:hypothetical protein
VVDNNVAIITSANLTAGGLYRNYEYGLEVTEQTLVSRIRTDIHEYGLLGASVGYDRLRAFCSVAKELRQLFNRKLKTVSNKLAREFEEKVQTAEDELIRMRLTGGAMHTVFENTLMYLLKRHGPMTTRQLHPIIASIHSDLCDDTIDRVIDGQHFGKKWKHAVRTAQQHLKKNGFITLKDKRWALTD